jgi:uncharacterized protein (UPF0333 family)
MEEARKKKILRSQRGQAVLEFMLILLLSIAFLRFVFFNKEYGFKASLDKTMLRVGSFLEGNLKTGTKIGADGEKSLDGFAGTSRWSN